MIELDNVSKRYGSSVVVDSVSVQIKKGGITAIIGPNGAGKSTLLGLMSRLNTVDAGTILVDGDDITRTPSEVLARRLSVLRQDNHYTARLTVRDLVSFGRYPYAKGRLRPDDLAQIDAALEQLELRALQHRFLDELSGGQRQRAFVAMVLAQDTDYLLLDEPLNNLDLRHAVSMMKTLRRIADELGKTVIIVIHDINFASCYADRILAMKDARVVYHGSVSALMTPELLTRIYDMPVDVQQIGSQRIGLYFR